MTKKKPIKCQKLLYQTILHQGEYPQSAMFNVSSLPLDLKKVSIQLHESTPSLVLTNCWFISDVFTIAHQQKLIILSTTR